MKKVSAIVMAAGKGTRMKSSLPKVLHPLLNKPMLFHVIDTLKKLGVKKEVIVIGHEYELLKNVLSDKKVDTVYQKKQNGTAQAVKTGLTKLKNFHGDVLVLSGDVPLLREVTLTKFLSFHRKNTNSISFMSTNIDDPKGYGRVIRDIDSNVTGIVEQKDLIKGQEKITEINGGIYLIKSSFLKNNINKIKNNNKQKEYYLPDLISLAIKDNKKTGAYVIDDFTEIHGINNRVELSEGSRILRERINNEHMLNGVTIIDPLATYIEGDVKIGKDVVIYPNTYLKGVTQISMNTQILEGTVINNSKIGEDTIIKNYCIIEDASVGNGAAIGPFARLRPQSDVRDNAKVGNFVELKKTVLGENSKANHFTYLGDATVGKNVNIGAGTITCNYDGKHKHKTVIKDNVFIGSNTEIIAPVTIEENAYIGAGSTITKNVSKESLALTRSPQREIKNYAQIKMKKSKTKGKKKKK